VSVLSSQAAVELSIARLMRNASRKARANGEKRIAARDIRKVTMVSGPASSQLAPADPISEELAQIQRINGEVA
jgi:hypothetical protein